MQDDAEFMQFTSRLMGMNCHSVDVRTDDPLLHFYESFRETGYLSCIPTHGGARYSLTDKGIELVSNIRIVQHQIRERIQPIF